MNKLNTLFPLGLALLFLGNLATGGLALALLTAGSFIVGWSVS